LSVTPTCSDIAVTIQLVQVVSVAEFGRCSIRNGDIPACIYAKH
jgi:hypothetical protein